MGRIAARDIRGTYDICVMLRDARTSVAEV